MWWNQYVGIPFVSKGRDRLGCDCWGLLRLVYAEQFLIQLPSYIEEYESANNRYSIAAPIDQHRNKWLPVNDPRTGDGVLFCFSGIPCHIGVVTEIGLMLHITKGIDASIEPYLSSRWRSRVEGIYRYIP